MGGARRWSFSAIVEKVGLNPCVAVPDRVSEALAGVAEHGRVQVKGTVSGEPYTSTLMPLGGGRHRLYLNGDIRKRAGVDVGDAVEVVLAFDAEPRDRPVPEALRRALEKDPPASEAFDALTPSRRQEILAYLNSLKRPASLERNVAKVIDILLRER